MQADLFSAHFQRSPTMLSPPCSLNSNLCCSNNPAVTTRGSFLVATRTIKFIAKSSQAFPLSMKFCKTWSFTYVFQYCTGRIHVLGSTSLLGYMKPQKLYDPSELKDLASNPTRSVDADIWIMSYMRFLGTKTSSSTEKVVLVLTSA